MGYTSRIECQFRRGGGVTPPPPYLTDLNTECQANNYSTSGESYACGKAETGL